MAGPAPTTPPPPGIPPERHVAALANAISNGWRPYRWPAYGAAFLAGIVAGGIAAPVVTSSVLLLLALVGGPPDPLPLALDELLGYVSFGAAFGLAGATAFVWSLPRDLRAAAETYVWLATRAEANWRASVGNVPVPRSESRMRALLMSAPQRPESAAQRFGGWIYLGELARAEATIEQIPGDTPKNRFTRASARWLLDFARGSAAAVDPLDALADEIPDPDEQIEARVDVAAKRARVAVAEGRDWRTPLAAVRPDLADAPVDPFRRRVWWPIARALGLAVTVGFAICWLVWTLFLEAAVERLAGL